MRARTYPPDQLAQRVAKIRAWLAYAHEIYADLLSRQEGEGLAGFDTEPRQKPCEHRKEWRRGRLCLACDNTGWRALTEKERKEGAGIDPYSAQLAGGFTVVRPESEGSRKAREARRVEAILAELERRERVRQGLEADEDPAMRSLRVVVTRKRGMEKILRAYEWLKSERPSLYADPEMRLLAIAMIVPGRVHQP